MKYTILGAKQLEDHIVTEVKYDFDDGQSETVTIPHFQPKTTDEIVQGIVNRGISEKKKHLTKEEFPNLLDHLILNQAVAIQE